MYKRKVLIINIGWEQEPLLNRLNEKGFQIYGIHNNDKFYKGVTYSDVKITEFQNLSEILKFAEKVKPDAVISDQCDYSYFAQSVIASKLNLPGPEIREAQISINKYLQRKKAKNKGIQIPKFQLITQVDEIHQFSSKVGFPIIIKPIDNRGSIGVKKISSSSDIQDAFYLSLVNSSSRLLIAEEFIEGREITVDGYIFNEGCKSVALATKQLISEQDQVAVDILYPGELDSNTYEKALLLNERINNKLGYRFGMTHSEYKIDSNGNIYLIESANRGGGVYTSEIIVPEVSGIDILEQYINDCMGIDKIEPHNFPKKNKVILKFLNLDEGELKEISGLDEVKSHPDVLKLRLSVSEGDVINPISSDANRHGFIIVSSDKARSMAVKLINKLKFTYNE